MLNMHLCTAWQCQPKICSKEFDVFCLTSIFYLKDFKIKILLLKNQNTCIRMLVFMICYCLYMRAETPQCGLLFFKYF